MRAARADLYRRLDLRAEAVVEYRLALELTANEPETRYLKRRLAEVS
jgi:predicted RNA polymerase sigma factor